MFKEIQANGTAIPREGTGDLANVKTVTATRTLTVEESGTCFILNAAAGVELALPDAGNGLNYKFVVGASFITTDWTVLAADTVIQGSVIVNGAHVAGANEDTISFVASAESVGDYVYIESDGTNWYVSGSGVTAGSITLTQA